MLFEQKDFQGQVGDNHLERRRFRAEFLDLWRGRLTHKPTSTILIFASGEYCSCVLRRMSLTNLSAASFDVSDFLFICTP